MDDLKSTQHIQYLRVKDIIKMLSISRSTWWAGVKTGHFPQPLKLGPRITVWRQGDILAMVERRNGGCDE